MKKSSLRAQRVNRTFYTEDHQLMHFFADPWHCTGFTYLVGVVQVQEPILALVNVLMARVGASDYKSSIHVHIVAREVESNQALE
jgi:hypothetical protein